MESCAEQGVLVEHSPYVQLLYVAVSAGDLSPARLRELTGLVRDTPPAIAHAYEHPNIARHVIDCVRELEQLRRPPIRVHGGQ